MGNTPTVLSTAIAGGNPPDLAAVGQPGLVQQFSGRKAIKPIDYVKPLMAKWYSPSWVKLGTEGTQAMLRAGANDVGGTLMEETISRMAGSEFGSAKSVAELVEIAAAIGRPARQRSTTYAPLAA